MKCKVFEPSIIQDKNEVYIDINEIAKIKGLKSNRSIRIAIQKGKLTELLKIKKEICHSLQNISNPEYERCV